MYYVYVYLDPRKEEYTLSDGERLDHEPFYVGKGKGKRAWCHLEPSDRSNNHLKKGKIQRIISSGFVPVVCFIVTNLSEQEAMVLEREWIARIGTKWTITGIKRGPLCNMTSGGDGYTMCDEMREIYSARFSGDGNPMHGKTHRPESRKTMGDKRRNVPHSRETKERMSAARRGGNNYNAKHWKVMLPDNEIVVVEDLKMFAKEQGINYNTLYNTMAKKKPATSGYWLLGPIVTRPSSEE